VSTQTRLTAFLGGNSDVLERLAVEMYARGLSTRDIEDALEEAPGDRLQISQQIAVYPAGSGE